MFSNCCKLINLNISNIITNNVTNMEGMFYWCKSLNKLNLSNFSTNNIIILKNVFWMFVIKRIKSF